MLLCVLTSDYAFLTLLCVLTSGYSSFDVFLRPLHSYAAFTFNKKSRLYHRRDFCVRTSYIANYFSIVATTPAPTVRPPSRIENLVPSSIAIGAINSTVISTLSPGITISTPSGRVMIPVTSVVRK